MPSQSGELAAATETAGAAAEGAVLRRRAIDESGAIAVEEFARRYVQARRPVILRGLVAEWPALGLSLRDLRQAHADLCVTAARARDGVVVVDEQIGFVHERLPLGELIDALQSGARDRYMITPLEELPAAIRAAAPPPPHCAAAAWHKANLWIGAAGTGGLLHRDLADNLHAQVAGRKRFTLVAPRQSACVYPNRLFDSVPNGCRVDIETPDLDRFPRLRDVELLIGELAPGDAIYIPRRWWHKGRTLATSISVNYWWASGLQRILVLSADTFKRLRGVSR